MVQATNTVCVIGHVNAADGVHVCPWQPPKIVSAPWTTLTEHRFGGVLLVPLGTCTYNGIMLSHVVLSVGCAFSTPNSRGKLTNSNFYDKGEIIQLSK